MQQCDQSITHVNEDEFERTEFAHVLTQLLLLPPDSPSFTLAIEGAWGIGKTSVINLVKERLEEMDESPIVIDFNPWLIGNLDSVVEGFLIQFATSINRVPNSEVAKDASLKLLQFAQLLSPIKLIPGVEPWGTILEKTMFSMGKGVKAAANLDKFDLVNRKQRLKEIISKLDAPIVVIIDDIDRLPPKEVRVIFQLVKAICDFDRVSYLLSYDTMPVHEALSYNGIYDGKKYLEKIVQATYPVPRTSLFHLKEYVKKRLVKILERVGIELNDSDVSLLNSALNEAEVVQAFKTPRDINRFLNNLLVPLMTTKKEVNAVDVMVFEILNTKFPSVTREIRNCPEIFLGESVKPLSYRMMMGAEETQQEKEKQVDEVLKELTGRDKDEAVSLLEFLFPNMFESMFDMGSEAKGRISTRPALMTLLQSGMTKFNVSTKAVEQLLSNKEGRLQSLVDFHDSGDLQAWFQHISSFLNEKVCEPVDLVEQLLKLQTIAVSKKSESIVNEIAPLIMKLIKLLPNSEQSKTLGDLISHEESIEVSEVVLLRLLQEAKMWDGGTYYNLVEAAEQSPSDNAQFDLKMLKFLKDAWLEVVKDTASNSPDVILYNPEVISILFRGGQLEENTYESVQLFIKDLVRSKEGIRRFVQVMPEPNDSFESGVFKFVENIPDMIERLKKLQGDSKAEKIISYLEGHEGSEDAR